MREIIRTLSASIVVVCLGAGCAGPSPKDVVELTGRKVAEDSGQYTPTQQTKAQAKSLPEPIAAAIKSMIPICRESELFVSLVCEYRQAVEEGRAEKKFRKLLEHVRDGLKAEATEEDAGCVAKFRALLQAVNQYIESRQGNGGSQPGL